MSIRPYPYDPQRFLVDYYPEGRSGKRVRLILPAGTELESARAIEESLISAKDDTSSHVTCAGTVNELYPEYLSWAEIYRAKSTCRDLKGTFNLYISKYLGDNRAENINVQHLNAYVKLRKAEQGSNRSIQKEIDYFRGFLKWCRKNLQGFRGTQITFDSLPYKRPKPTVLSFPEAILIIRAAEPFYRAFFLLLYNCGLRLSEARHLKWQDIDLANQSLSVIQKGGEENILPMSDWLTNELHTLQQTSTSAYVFQSSHKPIDAPIYDARKALQRAAAKAGITKKINHHTFRHSIATHLMGLDINQKSIQKILGHADIKTTDWYTHIAMGMKRTAMDKAGFDTLLTTPLKKQINGNKSGSYEKKKGKNFDYKKRPKSSIDTALRLK